MKTLIVARTSRGKDYLRELLESSYNWKFVKSRTTRKPRYEGENTHIFISREEAEATTESEIIAKTEINGEIYFATKEDLDKADAYIIDPNGIEYLCDKCKDEWFEILYIRTDEEAANNAARERAKNSPNPDAEFETYKKRCAAENDQFTTFEAYIENGSFHKENCYGIHVVDNDYKNDTMQQVAITLEMRRRFYANMTEVLDVIKKENNYIEYDKNHVHMFRKENNEPIIVRNELLIQLLAEEPKKSMFADLMETYLFRPTPDHSVSLSKSE